MKTILTLALSAAAVVAWSYSYAMENDHMLQEDDGIHNNDGMDLHLHGKSHVHAHSHHSLKNIAIRSVQTHTHSGALNKDHVNNTLPKELSSQVFEEGHTSYDPKLKMHKHSHKGYIKLKPPVMHTHTHMHRLPARKNIDNNK